MKITHHAAQRFLERVMQKSSYSKQDVYRSVEYLRLLFKDVNIHSTHKKVQLPGFDGYKAVFVRESIVTIIAKDNERAAA